MSRPEPGDGGNLLALRLEARDIADVGRILAKLTRAVGRSSVMQGARQIEAGSGSWTQEDSIETLAQQMFAANEARGRFLPKEVDEAAWNILLAVYLADRAGARHSMTRIAALSQSSSHTTAQRRIACLEQVGLIRREEGREDRRNVYLLLCESGSEAVEKVLSFALRR